MYVCTYVRMYVCTYVCMYVRMYICMYGMHACMYVCMYAHTHKYEKKCLPHRSRVTKILACPPAQSKSRDRSRHRRPCADTYASGSCTNAACWPGSPPYPTPYQSTSSNAAATPPSRPARRCIHYSYYAYYAYYAYHAYPAHSACEATATWD